MSKLNSLINGCDKLIKRLSDNEKTVRARWTKEYNRFMEKASEVAHLTIHGTLKEKNLQEAITSWPKRTKEITKNRDEKRIEIEKAKEQKQKYELELAGILAGIKAREERETTIVDQVFSLNAAVIEALELRNSFLTENVYDRLFDEQGNLRSQITIDNADGTKRVRAMVNTITRVESELAEKAIAKINNFFDRIMPGTEMDKITSTLFELTKKILIEKTSFNIGPDFYRFISIEFDTDLFPELKIAQELLRKSLRSEKTNSYIRLYERASAKDKWRAIPQTI